MCPATCPCRTVDPRNERELADNMLARCKCGEVFHQAHVTDRGPCSECRSEVVAERRGPARVGGRLGLVAALALAFGLGACASAGPRAVEVETVGQLVESRGSVTSAPVHATTDLGVAYQAVSSDDDEPSGDSGRLPVETPDVAPKAGLVMGTVRQ